MILFTGTGRCGTGYVCQVMNGLGHNCTHEGLFQARHPDITREELRARLANPEWGWEGESSWLAMPFLGWEELRDCTIVHLIRHPKRVMDSKIRIQHRAMDQHYGNWARTYALPELADCANRVDEAALWWLRFNERIAPYADITHCIEDPVTRLLDALGISYYGKSLYSNTRYNSGLGHRPSDVMLDDIGQPLRDEMVEASARYGYGWDFEPAWVWGKLFDDVRVKVSSEAAASGGSWQIRDTEGQPLAYDPGLVRFLAGKIGALDAPLLADIGASTGSFSLLPLVHDCRVVAFEPNPAAARALRINLKLNGLNGRVSVRDTALSDYRGDAVLTVPQAATWAAVACLGDGAFRRDDVPTYQVPVKVERLDDCNLAPDIIKIDVEGAELNVLRGAERTISAHHPGILIEYAPDNTRQFGYEPEAITDWLAAHGYTKFERVGIEDLWAT